MKLNNNDSLGTHIFFIDYTDNNGFSFAYDLYFTDEVDNKTISNIAQSVYIIQIYYTNAFKTERKSTDGYIHNIIEFYDDNINILNFDFYNKKDENKYYIYNGNSWFEIEDADSTLTNLFK